MRTPLQQLAPSFTSARAYRDWKNGPVLLAPEDIVATVLAAASPDFEKTTEIHGFDILLHGEEDCGDFVVWCHVNYDYYGSSLTLLEHEGYLESESDDDVLRVKQHIIDEIVAWAYDNGY